MKNGDARLMFYSENKKFDKSENRAFLREKLVFNVTEDILVAMEDLEITRADLARDLSKSKAYVTQTLSGERNMTLGTLSDICFALGIEPVVKICAPNEPYHHQTATKRLIAVKSYNESASQFTGVRKPNAESKVERIKTAVSEQKFDSFQWRQMASCK